MHTQIPHLWTNLCRGQYSRTGLLECNTTASNTNTTIPIVRKSHENGIVKHFDLTPTLQNSISFFQSMKIKFVNSEKSIGMPLLHHNRTSRFLNIRPSRWHHQAPSWLVLNQPDAYLQHGPPVYSPTLQPSKPLPAVAPLVAWGPSSSSSLPHPQQRTRKPALLWHRLHHHLRLHPRRPHLANRSGSESAVNPPISTLILCWLKETNLNAAVFGRQYGQYPTAAIFPLQLPVPSPVHSERNSV